MATPTITPSALLTDAAFGAQPQLWPLPQAHDPQQRWLRAVAAGGQGHYGTAFAELDEIIRQRCDGPTTALAYSTRASFLRQLGGHRTARRWDGHALVSAGTDPQARADALVGLAADALGIGRLAAAARLLQRAPGDSGEPRQSVRRHWVSAELAMACADGPAAIGHAEQAVQEADTLGSVRHRAKSQVVLAAALCCTGDLNAARRVADAAYTLTAEFGLVPLHWAVSCLLADIDSAVGSAAAIAAARDLAAETIRNRGGVWAGH
ncbi:MULTISPECIES: hypothetical protein [Mycobacteriaceae]|uniref:MalT-like TPR region domain-containing protein n=1 Tax=Mycolicibacterium neoaurum VKM Ac-1815D TaxID=700508 RepID=V5X9R6_MYCNE|nr:MULTISPECIES: hypothetical protein [Mycobacteriaceae]AHC24436.1 hypothetical protein D174_07485 [Mycolicibacterium neoaurum VKM Ac-1815D]AMO05034.1 hypothetical protein MyAD_07350 [Mycolicibacterium neoaurum]